MVTINLTPEEARFLQNRCIQARAVVYSNLRDEALRRGDNYEALRVEDAALDALIVKLGKVGAE